MYHPDGCPKVSRLTPSRMLRFKSEEVYNHIIGVPFYLWRYLENPGAATQVTKKHAIHCRGDRTAA